MNKKIMLILIAFICFFTFNFVNAESLSGFIDLQSYDNIYRLSEDADVKLPFIKIFKDKAIFDKNLNSTGLSIGSKTLEVNERATGLQLILSADTVEIKGSLEYGVIIAPNVVISGTVEKDILILSESTFITETANVYGDLITAAETVEMKGNIAGNFISSATSLLMQGNVEKDFRVYSEKMEFGSAKVKGAIYIETNSEVDISQEYPNSVVNKISYKKVTEEEQKADIINIVIKTLMAVVVFTLINSLIVTIKPNTFKNLSNKFLNYSSFAIVIGVLGIITMPVIITILLVLSIFGAGIVAIPALIVYIALMVVIIVLAKFITGSVIYEMVKDKLKINNKFKEIGLLLIIYTTLYLVSYIPSIGYFITIAIMLLSSGIVITGLTRKNK